MAIFFSTLLDGLPTWILIILIAAMLYLLGRSADMLIDQAVWMSLRWGVPKIIIGATIISLGTTLPETSVSVLAAINRQSSLALGNGVGSIITNIALILGLAVLIGRVPAERKLVMRQGSLMLLAIVILILAGLPFQGLQAGGRISRIAGIFFVLLLILYICYSVYSAKEKNNAPLADTAFSGKADSSVWLKVISKFILSLVLIILSSGILIRSVELTALRIGIPQGVIAATLVAFGTSLPELIMAIRSVRKGYGELALGNVIGANILNVLFVIGLSAAVSSAGLAVPLFYYTLQFPALLLLMAVFLLATGKRSPVLQKKYGAIFVVIYIAYLLISYR